MFFMLPILALMMMLFSGTSISFAVIGTLAGIGLLSDLVRLGAGHQPKMLEEADPKWLAEAKQKWYDDGNMLEFEQAIEDGLNGVSKTAMADLVVGSDVKISVHHDALDKPGQVYVNRQEYQNPQPKITNPCPACGTQLKVQHVTRNPYAYHGDNVIETSWCAWCAKKYLRQIPKSHVSYGIIPLDSELTPLSFQRYGRK